VKKGLLLLVAGGLALGVGILGIIAGLVTLIRNVPSGPLERVARAPGVLMGRMLEHLPDN
jgi:hypothetical protein